MHVQFKDASPNNADIEETIVKDATIVSKEMIRKHNC